VVAVVYIQEFPIQNEDTSNYDAVVAALDLERAPDGLIVHTAGFDRDGGVFRILDVWESRAQGERFNNDQLGPILESMMAAAGEGDWAPPTREGWYELHDEIH
jgi:hypothetical protein